MACIAWINAGAVAVLCIFGYSLHKKIMQCRLREKMWRQGRKEFALYNLNNGEDYDDGSDDDEYAGDDELFDDLEIDDLYNPAEEKRKEPDDRR